MADKAYIVANKQQELDVLKRLEQNGSTWSSGENPTEWVLSENSLFNFNASFPYALSEHENKKITWLAIGELTDEEIVYDGRNEEKMDKKYKVTQGFMNELIEWRDDNNLDAKTGLVDNFIDGCDINNIPNI